MSAQPMIKKASANLRTAKHAPLTDDRIGSLVQVNARTEVDDEGNAAQVRIEVDRAPFLQALPEELHRLVPPTKDPHKALRAAVTRAKKGIHEMGDQASDRRPHWTRVGKADNGTLIYALSIASIKADAAEVKTGQVANVRVSETGAMGVEWKVAEPNKTARDQVDAVVERYNKERERLHSDDVRTFVNRLLTEQKAVGVGGMLHLVPRDGDQVVLDAKPALVEAGYTVLVQPVAEGGYLAEEVSGGLLQEVARLSASVKRMAHALCTDGKDHRLATFDARMNQARALRARAGLFADLVGAAQDDVNAALAEVESVIRQAQVHLLTSIDVGG